MDIVTCSDYVEGESVVLQLTGGCLEYYGNVTEVGQDRMKVEIPFYNSTCTYTLTDGKKVTTLHKG